MPEFQSVQTKKNEMTDNRKSQLAKQVREWPEKHDTHTRLRAKHTQMMLRDKAIQWPQLMSSTERDPANTQQC